MNPESKQRIVGIIVLVILIALLVPFLFIGDIEDKQKPANDDNVLPVQFIDDNNHDANSKTDSEIISGPEKVTKSPQQTSMATQTVPLPSAEQYAVPPPNPQEIKSTVAKEPIVMSESEARPQDPPIVTPPLWSVQVGTFASQARAQKMAADLRAKGLQWVSLQEVSTAKGSMIRVLVGRETSKTQITRLVEQLKTKFKLAGYAVRYTE